VLDSWPGGHWHEDTSGRGEHLQQTAKTRPHSDCYGENLNNIENSSSTEYTFDYPRVTSESTGSSSYSTQTLPRRVKKASVVLREKRQSMMMIQESQEMVSGVFTLPRVSCYHRSTR